MRKIMILLCLAASLSHASTSVEDLRLRKRFGIGASGAGQLAMLGVEIDVNLSEEMSLGAGAGTGLDYSTAMVKLRYYLSGQWVSPYFAAALARWWSSGTRETKVRPSVLANKFLDPGQNLTRGFDIWIVSPSFGVQFMHHTGLSFFAELQTLFKIYTLANGTYAGVGLIWYF
jgi:hypothetical protein